MRIAVVNITGGGLSGGYRKYLQKVLPLIAREKQVDGLDVYVPFSQSDLFSEKTFTLHHIPTDTVGRNIAWLKNELAVCKPDVVYIPSALWINCGQIPVVIMIQNMEPLVVPFQGNPLQERIKNICRYTVNLYACKRAHRTIAISKFVKTYLTKKWGIASDRIGLVYHGIDSTTKASSNECYSSSSLQSVPFLFTAGSIRPARGLEDAISALAMLNAKQPMHLAIAGNIDPGMNFYFNKLNNMALRLGISDRIHWLNKLNDTEMAWHFNHCEAFIMTSRVESFGMIAGEAMAHGCICVSSDNPCLPEIFGPSALYYPPKDFTTLTKQIRSVLAMGEAERTTMASNAKNIASKFSWEICAQKTFKELQEAVL